MIEKSPCCADRMAGGLFDSKNNSLGIGQNIARGQIYVGLLGSISQILDVKLKPVLEQQRKNEIIVENEIFPRLQKIRRSIDLECKNQPMGNHKPIFIHFLFVLFQLFVKEGFRA